MSKARLRVPEEDSPATLLVDVLAISGADLVTENLHLLGVRTDQLLQQCLNDRLHARTENNNRNVVLQAPLEELCETGVELDIVDDVLDALVVGASDAVHHVLKRIAEGDFVVQTGDIALAALLAAITDCVGQKVIAL